MTIEEMKERKRELGYSIEDLAGLCGVPVGTLRKVFSGATKNPRRITIDKLTAALEKKEKSGPGSTYYHLESHSQVKENPGVYEGIGQVKESAGGYEGTGQVKESPLAYGNIAEIKDIPCDAKKQGEYTIEDYFALPDDKRYELIDGVIYDMASPSRNHQVIAGYLYHILMTCSEKHPSECHPYIAPLDVQLDKDNRTMVQPDVIICCQEEQDSGSRIFGAPDFLAEVVSPSSKSRDRFVKLRKYKEAGVREYWMIEPEREQVIVFLFEDDDRIAIYSFDDEISVSISDGTCKVCFAPVKERLNR